MKKKSLISSLSIIFCLLLTVCFMFMGCQKTEGGAGDSNNPGTEQGPTGDGTGGNTGEEGGDNEGTEPADWVTLTRGEAEAFLESVTFNTSHWSGFKFVSNSDLGNPYTSIFYDVDDQNGDSFIYEYNSIGVPEYYEKEIKEYYVDGTTFGYYTIKEETTEEFKFKMNDKSVLLDLNSVLDFLVHYDMHRQGDDFGVVSMVPDTNTIETIEAEADAIEAEYAEAGLEVTVTIQWNNFSKLEGENGDQFKMNYSIVMEGEGMTMAAVCDLLFKFDSQSRFQCAITTQSMDEKESVTEFSNYTESISAPSWFNADDDFTLVEKVVEE